MTARVRRSRPAARRKQISRFELGATQTQNSLDWWNGSPTDINRGVANVNAAVRWKNHHICSFGSLSPEETIGVFDWPNCSDERIPGSPAANISWSNPDNLCLTMAMAPSWMAPGGTSGVTDWANINQVAPTSTHYADFAAVCASAITRYTQVSAAHIWNEFKGFYNNTLGRIDYEGYTSMYNLCYTAIKGVRSTVQVGGPYLIVYVTGNATTTELSGPWGYVDQPTLDGIKYWLANKNGADFILLDGGNMTADNVPLVTPMVAAETLVPAVAAWLRSLNPATYPGCTTLPIVFAEWYIWGDHWLNTQPSHAQTAATWTVGCLAAMKAGISRVFVWEPMGDVNGDLAPYSPMGLCTDTHLAGGGQTTPLQVAGKLIKDNFPPGKVIMTTKNTNANIFTIATPGAAILVNKTGSSQTTANFTPSTTLAAWEIKLVVWTP